VDEVRPPRRVVRIDGFHCATMEVFYRNNVEAEGSMIECVRLVGDRPWWRSSAVQVAARAWCVLRLWSWHSVGDDGANSSGFLLALLPGCGGSVLLCALFVCGGVGA
jgi:hypothetical protein